MHAIDSAVLMLRVYYRQAAKPAQIDDMVLGRTNATFPILSSGYGLRFSKSAAINDAAKY